MNLAGKKPGVETFSTLNFSTMKFSAVNFSAMNFSTMNLSTMKFKCLRLKLGLYGNKISCNLLWSGHFNPWLFMLKFQPQTFLPQRIKKVTVQNFTSGGLFCQFPFRWFYHYGSTKSTGKETGKTHLCALCLLRKRLGRNWLLWLPYSGALQQGWLFCALLFFSKFPQ